ncbi:hypothetical protein DOT_0569 [Desulfosporosinus sp. OT]|nr:hypothetical protein DOT_0569 [Desulfosporosinus sp. OT]
MRCILQIPKLQYKLSIDGVFLINQKFYYMGDLVVSHIFII